MDICFKKSFFSLKNFRILKPKGTKPYKVDLSFVNLALGSNWGQNHQHFICAAFRHADPKSAKKK
jgi:hypothetical protein